MYGDKKDEPVEIYVQVTLAGSKIFQSSRFSELDTSTLTENCTTTSTIRRLDEIVSE